MAYCCLPIPLHLYFFQHSILSSLLFSALASPASLQLGLLPLLSSALRVITTSSLATPGLNSLQTLAVSKPTDPGACHLFLLHNNEYTTPEFLIVMFIIKVKYSLKKIMTFYYYDQQHNPKRLLFSTGFLNLGALLTCWFR